MGIDLSRQDVEDLLHAIEEAQDELAGGETQDAYADRLSDIGERLEKHRESLPAAADLLVSGRMDTGRVDRP